jgi:hypothetical protein
MRRAGRPALIQLKAGADSMGIMARTIDNGSG